MRTSVAVVVSVYTLADLLIFFINKAVLNFSPHIPSLFLFLQLAVTAGFLHLVASFSSKVVLPTRVEISWSTIKQLIPLISVNVAGLFFGMLCLRDVDASFFQITRGLVLPLTIMISSCTTKVSPSIPVLICAFTVTFGFFVGALPSSLLSLSFDTLRWPAYSSISRVTTSSKLISLLYGVLSSLFVAIHTVLVKHSLPYLEDSTIKLAWWSNLGGALVLLPFVLLSGDIPFALGLIRYGVDIRGNVGGFGIWNWWLFLLGSTVTALFRFLLCLAGNLGVEITSPISHMLSDASNGIFQTLLGVWLFGDILTVPRASSILVILTGNILYTLIKARENGPNGQYEMTEELKDSEDTILA